MNSQNTTGPETQSRADAPVRAGSSDPANPEPPATLNPANRERSERLPPQNPSTGPKTQSGKSISSKNAVTHGLRAKKLENAVSADTRKQYETLRKQYLDEYKPAGAIENTLFDMLLFAAWQLYKIREMELFTELDLGLTGSFGRSERIARYRSSHERLFFRSLNQIKQIQQERLLRETDQKAALPAHLPPAVRLKPLFDHLKRLRRHPKTRLASATIPKSANRDRRESGRPREGHQS